MQPRRSKLPLKTISVDDDEVEDITKLKQLFDIVDHLSPEDRISFDSRYGFMKSIQTSALVVAPIPQKILEDIVNDRTFWQKLQELFSQILKLTSCINSYRIFSSTEIFFHPKASTKSLQNCYDGVYNICLIVVNLVYDTLLKKIFPNWGKLNAVPLPFYGEFDLSKILAQFLTLISIVFIYGTLSKIFFSIQDFASIISTLMANVVNHTNYLLTTMTNSLGSNSPGLILALNGIKEFMKGASFSIFTMGSLSLLFYNHFFSFVNFSPSSSVSVSNSTFLQNITTKLENVIPYTIDSLQKFGENNVRHVEDFGEAIKDEIKSTKRYLNTSYTDNLTKLYGPSTDVMSTASRFASEKVGNYFNLIILIFLTIFIVEISTPVLKTTYAAATKVTKSIKDFYRKNQKK
jgi:hypothetical protein